MRFTAVVLASTVATVAATAPLAVAPIALSSCCFDGPCDGSDHVGVKLSCSTIVPAAVTLTGPCAATADADSQAAVQVSPSEIYFGSSAAGVCHFALALPGGFAYSGDATFVGNPPSACGCQPFFSVMNPVTFFVDVPFADCAPDAGGLDASSADDGSDSN
jgi:hypothetical protein